MNETSLPTQAPASRNARAKAFGVHIFTALGAAIALFALVEAVRQQWAAMFIWLGVALIIDGVDGTLARKFKVSETLPRWSGDALDLVVDYVTYVFIPAYAIVASDLMPPTLAVPLGGAIVVSSALYFADRRMKTDDYHFRGFPALWNVVAFYLFLLTPRPWVSGAIVVAFVVMTFVPIHVLHPLRVVRWRKITLILTTLWAGLSVFAVLRSFDVSAWHAAALTAIGLYMLAADSMVRLFNWGAR